MRTLLVGNFGAHNVGDELILAAALHDYPKATVMTANAKLSQKFCETTFKTVEFPPTAFRSFGRYASSKNYRAQVQALKGFDQIIFAGGGLFAIKLRACALWFFVFKWLKFLNPAAEFKFEYQGVDKNLSGMSKRQVKMVFSAADFVSVRDKNSLEALQSLGIKNVTLTEDRVWLWLKAIAKHKTLAFNQEGDKDLILVNALDYGGAEIFEIEHAQAHHEIKFVAFAPSDLTFVPLGVTAVLPSTKTEVLDLFASGTKAVGERLHFLIVAQAFSVKEDVYLLRRPYSEKVKSFTTQHDIKVYKSVPSQFE